MKNVAGQVAMLFTSWRHLDDFSSYKLKVSVGVFRLAAEAPKGVKVVGALQDSHSKLHFPASR